MFLYQDDDDNNNKYVSVENYIYYMLKAQFWGPLLMMPGCMHLHTFTEICEMMKMKRRSSCGKTKIVSFLFQRKGKRMVAISFESHRYKMRNMLQSIYD